MSLVSQKQQDMDGATAQSVGLDKPFVATLIGLIDTDDPREREVLKNLIVKIFSKLSNLRSTVRARRVART